MHIRLFWCFFGLMISMLPPNDASAMDPKPDTNWWGIKAKNMPDSLSLRFLGDSLFLKLDMGFQGCRDLVIKANTVKIKIDPELVSMLTDTTAIQIWAHELWINGELQDTKNYRHVNEQIMLAQDRIFLAYDDNHLVQKSLVTGIDCTRLHDGETFNLNPKNNVVGELKALFASLKAHFAMLQAEDSTSFDAEIYSCRVWKLPNPLHINLGESKLLYQYFGCVKNAGTACPESSYGKEKFKELYVDVLEKFNEFCQAIVPYSESEDAYHCFTDKGTPQRSGGIVLIPKNPRSDGDVDFVAKIFSTSEPHGYECSKEIFHTPAIRISLAKNYAQSRVDGFNILIEPLKDILFKRQPRIYSQGEWGTRLYLYTARVANNHTAIATNDF